MRRTAQWLVLVSVLCGLTSTAYANRFENSFRQWARELGWFWGEGYHHRPTNPALRPEYQMVTSRQRWAVTPPPPYPASSFAPMLPLSALPASNGNNFGMYGQSGTRSNLIDQWQPGNQEPTPMDDPAPDRDDHRRDTGRDDERQDPLREQPEQLPYPKYRPQNSTRSDKTTLPSQDVNDDLEDVPSPADNTPRQRLTDSLKGPDQSWSREVVQELPKSTDGEAELGRQVLSDPTFDAVLDNDSVPLDELPGITSENEIDEGGSPVDDPLAAPWMSPSDPDPSQYDSSLERLPPVETNLIDTGLPAFEQRMDLPAAETFVPPATSTDPEAADVQEESATSTEPEAADVQEESAMEDSPAEPSPAVKPFDKPNIWW